VDEGTRRWCSGGRRRFVCARGWEGGGIRPCLYRPETFSPGQWLDPGLKVLPPNCGACLFFTFFL
jgi:hypothetical protein